jgi:hypothetical protein
LELYFSLHTYSLRGQEHLYLYYTWLKWFWIVCKVLKREKDEASSQHPTRPTYAKFEASSANSPTIRPFSSVISPIQLTLTLQFAKYWQHECRKLNPLQDIVHFTVST